MGTDEHGLGTGNGGGFRSGGQREDPGSATGFPGGEGLGHLSQGWKRLVR